MRFVKLEISNGLFLDGINDEYSAKSNLLFSTKNSVGKSTYLRILFHSFGYPIPDMFGMKFKNLLTKLTIEEKGEIFVISREPNNLSVKTKNESRNFSLPNEHLDFLSFVFKNENSRVLSNLLGLMYVDQEKGWTLLNRGTVIGKNHFDVESLLSGIGDIDCERQLALKETLEKQNKKYKSLIELNDLKQSILNDNHVIEFSDYEKETKRKIDYLNLKINDLKNDIKDLDFVINKNVHLFNYLSSMHLFVVSQDGSEIPVNQKTLRGANDTNNLLSFRKRILNVELKQLENQLIECRANLDNYYLKTKAISLFDNDKIGTNEFLFKSIATLDINLIKIQDVIEENTKQISILKKELAEKILKNAKLNEEIFSKLYEYCTTLGISSKVINDPKFLYTDKLKYYSGTDFHKLVIAFKVVLHKAAEKYLNTSLPFIVDSPSGRELKEENIDLTISFIKEQLKDSQLFIASIKEIDSDKILYFHQYAIEDHSKELPAKSLEK